MQVEYYTGGRAELPDHKAVEVVAKGRGFPIVDGQAASPQMVVLCQREEPQTRRFGDKPPGFPVPAYLIDGRFVADGGGSVSEYECRPYKNCLDADNRCDGCINRPKS